LSMVLALALLLALERRLVEGVNARAGQR
jgi:hypothetical protein